MNTITTKSAIAPGIHKFDTGPFNWYLIEEDGRLTLVDAGFPGHYKIFKRGLAELGYAPKDVEAIVLTHAHADHIGFAEKLRKEVNIPVYIHREDTQMAQKPLQLPWFGLLSNAWRPYTASILGVAIMNGVFTFPRLNRVYELADGEQLEVPGRPRVIHTPGHTRGEIVLHLPKRGVLLSGDAIVTRNLLTGALGQPQLTNPVLNYDFQDARRSLSRLKELGDLIILPGHGIPWKGNVQDAVLQAKQSHR